jgi:predicted esterase
MGRAIALWAAATGVALACGGQSQVGDTDETADELADASDDARDDEGPAPSCPTYNASHVLVDGSNLGFRYPGASRGRDFELRLPTHVADSGPWPVVYVWHDQDQTAAQAIALVTDLVDEPGFPFIAVAPEAIPLDTDTAPAGFIWDNLYYDSRRGNEDAGLAFAVLMCLDEAFGIDWERVYHVGFGAGAVMADYELIANGNVVAGAASYSGAFFSDPAQRVCLGTQCTTWPPSSATTFSPVLLIWGGDADTYMLAPGTILDFNELANLSISHLTREGHAVVACNHGGGHVIPADLGARQFIEFFRDHPFGVRPEPYAAGLPADFPGYCSVDTP